MWNVNGIMTFLNNLLLSGMANKWHALIGIGNILDDTQKTFMCLYIYALQATAHINQS